MGDQSDTARARAVSFQSIQKLVRTLDSDRDSRVTSSDIRAAFQTARAAVTEAEVEAMVAEAKQLRAFNHAAPLSDQQIYITLHKRFSKFRGLWLHLLRVVLKDSSIRRLKGISKCINTQEMKKYFRAKARPEGMLQMRQDSRVSLLQTRTEVSENRPSSKEAAVNSQIKGKTINFGSKSVYQKLSTTTTSLKRQNQHCPALESSSGKPRQLKQMRFARGQSVWQLKQKAAHVKWSKQEAQIGFIEDIPVVVYPREDKYQQKVEFEHRSFKSTSAFRISLRPQKLPYQPPVMAKNPLTQWLFREEPQSRPTLYRPRDRQLSLAGRRFQLQRESHFCQKDGRLAIYRDSAREEAYFCLRCASMKLLAGHQLLSLKEGGLSRD